MMDRYLDRLKENQYRDQLYLSQRPLMLSLQYSWHSSDDSLILISSPVTLKRAADMFLRAIASQRQRDSQQDGWQGKRDIKALHRPTRSAIGLHSGSSRRSHNTKKRYRKRGKPARIGLITAVLYIFDHYFQPSIHASFLLLLISLYNLLRLTIKN